MTRLLLVLLCAGPATALQLHYDVKTPKPASHLYHVTVTVSDVKGDQLDLAMPAWTPGYYKIQNHAKNVREVRARADGKDLRCAKTDKQTWRIETGGAKTVEVSYLVYARQMSATGSDLEENHAYFHGSWLFMYAPAAKLAPVTLRLHPLAGWKIATGLEKGAGEHEFTAPNYDVLIDCPVLMSDFALETFESGGALHEVVMNGEPKCDRKAMVADIRKIVEAHLAMFGAPPYSKYVFLLHFPRWGGGGLEHLNSTSIVFNGESMSDRNQYLRFLFIVSHEFFHLWNVKRIRPFQLGPFDYTKEVHTKCLWVHEGCTTYYGWLFMQRGGVIDRKEYVNFVQEDVQNLLRRDGRRITSPEMSSWDTWLDPDDGEDVEVSYYTTGHLLGLLLDLRIRKETGGKKSLDDVMRLAYEGTKRAGYPGDDFLAIANEASGLDWTEFFAKHVSGTEEFPFAESLKPAGLVYEVKDDGAEPWAGFDVNGIGEDLVRVRRVWDDSPAGDAGLDENDVLLSAEGKRLRIHTFWGWLNAKKPGESVTFAVFRGERMIEKTIVLKERRKLTHIVRLAEKPDEGQKAILDAWLRAEEKK